MNKKIKVFKSLVVIALIMFMLFSFLPSAFARITQETLIVNFNNIQIAVDGQRIDTEFEPFVSQGRTYLPVRDVANAMGFGVTWEDATNTVHLTSGAANPQPFRPAIGSIRQQSIIVNFNNIRVAVNGTLVNTEFDPFVFQGRTYLPVRDVANAMNFEVTWEDATNTVHLTTRTESGRITPNYPAHISDVPTANRNPGGGSTPSPGSGSSPSPGNGSTPSPGSNSSSTPGSSSSPSPGSWSSPSPGGWSSPSPGNPRWTGTGGREWTRGT